jgi:hypothetical protein
MVADPVQPLSANPKKHPKSECLGETLKNLTSKRDDYHRNVTNAAYNSYSRD